MNAADWAIVVSVFLAVIAMSVLFIGGANLLRYYIQKSRAARATIAVRTFAEQQKLTYVAPLLRADHTEVGSLPNMSKSKALSDMLTGVVAGFPVRLFGFSYRVKSGKNSYDVHVMVGSVDLPHRMPHMVIDSLIDESLPGSVLPIAFDRSQKMDLEGDFYKYFSVYAPNKRELDALILLAPDVMLTMLELGAKCDIEFIDNRMYVYLPCNKFDGQVYQDMLTTVETLLAELGAKLKRFDKASVGARTGVIHTNATVDVSPSRLKKKFGLVITVGILAIFFVPTILAESLGQDIGDVIGYLYILIIPLFIIIGVVQARRKSKLRAEVRERYGKKPHKVKQ